jgi:hypothetical protein
VARQDKQKDKRRAADVMAGDDGEQCRLGCSCRGCSGHAAAWWQAAIGCSDSSRHGAALMAAALKCLPAAGSHLPHSLPHLLCYPAACAAAVSADAYAECYPSYYDHGTVLEDSDEEGARPEAEQVRRRASMK